MNYWQQSEKNIYVAAHRGLSWRYPDNSLPAFQAAIDAGADQIEFDVRTTLDGQLVLFHNNAVDEVTDGTGTVESYTLADLKKLDAGVKMGIPCQIPTLEEALALMAQDTRLTLDVELKEAPGPCPTAYQVCDRTLEMVDAFGFTDRCVINSFSGQILEYVAQKYPGKYKIHGYYPASIMNGVTVDPLDYAYCVCVFGPAGPEDYARIREKGVQPWAFVAMVDDAAIDQLVRDGIQLVTCNNADTAMELLRRRGLHT